MWWPNPWNTRSQGWGGGGDANIDLYNQWLEYETPNAKPPAGPKEKGGCMIRRSSHQKERACSFNSLWFIPLWSATATTLYPASDNLVSKPKTAAQQTEQSAERQPYLRCLFGSTCASFSVLLTKRVPIYDRRPSFTITQVLPWKMSYLSSLLGVNNPYVSLSYLFSQCPSQYNSNLDRPIYPPAPPPYLCYPFHSLNSAFIRYSDIFYDVCDLFFEVTTPWTLRPITSRILNDLAWVLFDRGCT